LVYEIRINSKKNQFVRLDIDIEKGTHSLVLLGEPFDLPLYFPNVDGRQDEHN